MCYHIVVDRDAVKYIALRSLGNFLLLFAIFGVLATFGPALYYELQYQVIKARHITYRVETPQQAATQTAASANSGQTVAPRTGPGFGDVLSGSTEQVLVPPDTSFSIVVPKIGATARVFPNVDPNDPQIYMPILLQGVAHAKGTVFPGTPGTTYLFAHSTDNWWDVGRYNAVFYLLKDLKPGDEIIIFFEGRRYDYVVNHSVIGDASDVSYIINSHTTPQQLVLQTCWPPGTSWKRIFVVAYPKGE